MSELQILVGEFLALAEQFRELSITENPTIASLDEKLAQEAAACFRRADSEGFLPAGGELQMDGSWRDWSGLTELPATIPGIEFSHGRAQFVTEENRYLHVLAHAYPEHIKALLENCDPSFEEIALSRRRYMRLRADACGAAADLLTAQIVQQHLRIANGAQKNADGTEQISLTARAIAFLYDRRKATGKLATVKRCPVSSFPAC